LKKKGTRHVVVEKLTILGKKKKRPSAKTLIHSLEIYLLAVGTEFLKKISQSHSLKEANLKKKKSREKERSSEKTPKGT